MAINKVVLNNEVQLDLTADTVTADKLLKGYTAHDKSGASIVGNMRAWYLRNGIGLWLIYKVILLDK